MNPIRTAAVLTLALFASACAQIPTADDLAPGVVAAPDPVTTLATISVHELTPAVAEQAEARAPEPAPAARPEPAAPPVTDLWVRVRNGFTKNDIDNGLVRQWEVWYASRPEYVARMMDQARRILFHVVEEVERRRMPTEIALVPMIESAFNPQAYSAAHASGIWQFIPATGRLYGLQQNFWYDGRRDIVAATSAALDYFEKLYAMFGDWDLALASYNRGEGAVQRAIARNQARGLPTDYQSLRMPAETRNYVPKLQAVKNIISDPERFGLTLPPIPNQPYFGTITTGQHMDVEIAARLAGISVEEFRFLNPAHNKPVINANTAEVIVLPREAVERFAENLAAYDSPLVSWQAYTIRPGDRPENIAARYGISLAALMRVNNIASRGRFRVGLSLVVPVKAGATPHLPNLPAPRAATSRPAKRYVAAAKKGPAKKVAQAKATGKKPAPKIPRPADRKKEGPGKIRVADAENR